MMNDNLLNELKNILDNNRDKRICVVGTTCTGKSTLLESLVECEDMDEVIFPLLTKEESEYVCQTPWTPEIGAYMDNLVQTKIKIKAGTPLFGTVILDADLIVYLHINDDLLKLRTKSRGADFMNAKNMQTKLEEEINNTKTEVITLEV